MARTPERRATPAAPASARGDDGTGAAAADEPGIDAILDQLEGVVRELEGGELPLELALERFELGVGLGAATCCSIASSNAWRCCWPIATRPRRWPDAATTRNDHEQALRSGSLDP
jgi:hypothetical protein